MHGGTLMLQPGLMMERPLLISGVIEHAAGQFGSTQIASRETHGPVVHYTFAECAARAVGAFTIVIGPQLSARIAGATINETKHDTIRFIRPPC